MIEWNIKSIKIECLCYCYWLLAGLIWSNRTRCGPFSLWLIDIDKRYWLVSDGFELTMFWCFVAITGNWAPGTGHRALELLWKWLNHLNNYSNLSNDFIFRCWKLWNDIIWCYCAPCVCVCVVLIRNSVTSSQGHLECKY